jgi:hypothetical protein
VLSALERNGCRLVDGGTSSRADRPEDEAEQRPAESEVRWCAARLRRGTVVGGEVAGRRARVVGVGEALLNGSRIWWERDQPIQGRLGVCLPGDAAPSLMESVAWSRVRAGCFCHRSFCNRI